MKYFPDIFGSQIFSLRQVYKISAQNFMIDEYKSKKRKRKEIVSICLFFKFLYVHTYTHRIYFKI